MVSKSQETLSIPQKIGIPAPVFEQHNVKNKNALS